MLRLKDLSLKKSAIVIDLSNTPGNNRGPSVTPTSAINPAKTDTPSASSLNVGIKLLQALPQQHTLQVQVKQLQVMQDNDKTLLQKLNPNLARQLATTLNASQPLAAQKNNTIATTLANNTLYLATLALPKTGGGNSNSVDAVIKVITPLLLSINQTVTVQKQRQQLSIQAPKSQPELPTIVANTLKQLLPQQQPVSQLHQFIQRLEQLPTILQNQLVSKSVIESLAPLREFTFSEKQLQTPPPLIRALANSGIQLEHKITQQASIATDLRTTLSNVIRVINHQQNAPLPPLDDKKLNTLINQLAATTAAQTTLVQMVTNQTQAPVNHNTVALLQLLGLPVPTTKEQPLPLPVIIQQHLKQLIEKTQAQIHLNQLRSLGLDKLTTDKQPTFIQQFHTELPLRFSDQVLPLTITIQEHEQEHPKEESDNTQEKESNTGKTQRRWQVFMSFELPGNEHLHTQLTLTNDHVSATLWAESRGLCETAQHDINVLRDKLLSKGLVVDDLNCHHGQPPQQTNSMGYQLVDIRT